MIEPIWMREQQSRNNQLFFVKSIAQRTRGDKQLESRTEILGIHLHTLAIIVESHEMVDQSVNIHDETFQLIPARIADW